MTLDELKQQLPNHLRDVKLNVSSVLNDESGLSKTEIGTIALCCAYAINTKPITMALLNEFKDVLDDSHINAAQSGSAIMSMNNVYYRFIHLVSDNEYQTLPAKLRMNVIGNPGVEKKVFELASLAVSAINGCGLCVDSHVKTLEKEGATKLMIQHAVRIGAMLNSFNNALTILDKE